MAAGVYSVTANARDSQGLTASSSPITVKISKALKAVRSSRKNASIIESSFTSSNNFSPNSAVQASSVIDALVTELEQAYLDFNAERTMFASTRRMDDYLFASLFLARASASLAKEQSQTNAISDRMSKLDAYLSFCEDLMVKGSISQATIIAANQVKAMTNLVIIQPDTLPATLAGTTVSPGEIARITTTSSAPFTTQTGDARTGHSFELANVSVTIKGQAAELLSVSPTTVEFLMPGDLAGGLVDVVVTSRSGFISYSTAAVSGLNPTIFMNGETAGRGAILNALNIHSGAFATMTPAQYLGLDSRTRLSILATGISTGLANTDFSNDILLGNGQRLTNLAESVQVEARTGAGILVKLPVEYAGSQGLLSGLDQVNVILPSQLSGAGSVQLTLVIGSVRSNPVTIVVD